MKYRARPPRGTSPRTPAAPPGRPPGSRAAPAAESPRGREERAPRAKPSEILYHDLHLVVANKIAGQPATAGRGDADSLPHFLAKTLGLPNPRTLRVVDRLEREASGLIVYALNLRARQGLVRQFMQHAVQRTYLALVSGYVHEDGEVNLPLGVDRRHGAARIALGRGKPARTSYRVLERVAGHTLLECRPDAGRLHQVRVHLAARGHPLAVDPLYGGGQSVVLSHFKSGYRTSTRHPERPLIERLTLHSATLAFDHPVTGERLSFEAAPPKDFRATVAQLARALNAPPAADAGRPRKRR